MKLEELIKMGEEISIILQKHKRSELVKQLAQFIHDYEEIKDEVATFVHGEVESESEASETSLPELEDEDMIVKVDKGFHSIK